MLSTKHDSDYDNVVLGRLALWINLFICPLHSHYITMFLFSLRLIVTLSLMFHNLKLSTFYFALVASYLFGMFLFIKWTRQEVEIFSCYSSARYCTDFPQISHPTITFILFLKLHWDNWRSWKLDSQVSQNPES